MAYARTYYADFSAFLSDEARTARLADITPERRARIETAKREETKAALLAGGLIIRAALLKEHGLTDFALTANEYGKPSVSGREDIHFNISHSGTTVACTVSDTECGVDIEKIDAPHDMMGVANRFFSLMEYNAMLMSANPAEAFCRLWTLRESYVKMRGLGFDIGLSTLRCDFHRGVCSIYQNEILQADAHFHEFRDIAGYRTAVCTLGEASHEICRIAL